MRVEREQLCVCKRLVSKRFGSRKARVRSRGDARSSLPADFGAFGLLSGLKGCPGTRSGACRGMLHDPPEWFSKNARLSASFVVKSLAQSLPRGCSRLIALASSQLGDKRKHTKALPRTTTAQNSSRVAMWALLMFPLMLLFDVRMSVYHGKQDSLEGYLQLLLPVLLRMIELRDVGLEVRNITLAVVLHLTSDTRYLFDNASR